MTSEASHAAVTHCHNCGTELGVVPKNFCPQCGQETHLEPLSIKEYLLEFFEHYLAPTGILWRTVWCLLSKPGQLSVDYRNGLRNRYVRPMRLVFTLVILTLIVGKVETLIAPKLEADAWQMVATMYQEDREKKLAVARAKPEVSAERIAKLSTPAKEESATYLKRKNDFTESVRLYIVLVTAPLLALFYRWFFSNRPYAYGDYLVFALHAACVPMVLGLLITPLQPLLLSWLGMVVAVTIVMVVQFFLAIPVYLFIAFRRAYTGTIAKTFARVCVATLLILALNAAAGVAVNAYFHRYVLA